MSTFRTSYYKFLNPTETMKFYFERNAPILNSNMHIIKIQLLRSTFKSLPFIHYA